MRLQRIGLVLIATVGLAWPQSEPAAPPQLEVTSVKPASPDERGTYIRPGPGGGVSITNMSMKEMMALAWKVQAFQISGGPAWISSSRYDVVAKPEARATQSEIPLLLQALLADRFQLTIHRETKELPVYAMVFAKKDGKPGPGLTESKEGGCSPPDPSRPPPPPEPGKPFPMMCGGMMMGRGQMRAVGVPVANLAPMLSRLLERTVIDQTGLSGKFDITLEWTPDESQGPLLPAGAPAPPPSDANGPSIFTAMQEQLGLKLESTRGQVEILVIDRAEKPSEN